MKYVIITGEAGGELRCMDRVFTSAKEAEDHISGMEPLLRRRHVYVCSVLISSHFPPDQEPLHHERDC